MFTIQVTFSISTKADFERVQNGLLAIMEDVSTTKSLAAKPVESEAAPVAPVEKPVKPAKIAKKQPVPEPAEEPAETEAEDTAEEPAEKPLKASKKQDASTAPSIKDVRAIFSLLLDVLGAAKGPTKGREILKKYAAKDIQGLNQEDYPNVIADVEAVIKAAGSSEKSEKDDIFGTQEEEETDEN